MQVSRRQYLAATGLLASSAVAGCTDGPGTKDDYYVDCGSSLMVRDGVRVLNIDGYVKKNTIGGEWTVELSVRVLNQGDVIERTTVHVTGEGSTGHDFGVSFELGEEAIPVTADCVVESVE